MNKRQWKKIYGFKKKEMIKVGDLFMACSYHPIRCTEVSYIPYNKYDGQVEGIALTDNQVRYCSIYNCGARKITQAQADTLIEAYKKDKERGLMRVCGWSEVATDKFMEEWRKPEIEIAS